MIQKEIGKRACQLLHNNFRTVNNERFFIPSPGFYSHQFYWDATLMSIAASLLGLKKMAESNLISLLRHQREDGWIPNVIYRDQHHFLKFIEYERWLTFRYPNYYSSYSQPPLLGQVTEYLNNPSFTRKYARALLRSYTYFIEKQDPDGDNLISICHPNETGRDNDQTFRKILKRATGIDPKNYLLNRLAVMRLNKSYKKVDWDIEKIWHLNLFNLEDVMFNALIVDGLASLDRVFQKTDRIPEEIKDKPKKLLQPIENAIYRLMWSPEKKLFYPLDSGNCLIDYISISNLFGLLLPNISQEMVEGTLSHLLNPNEFWTDYPIPSLPADSLEFKPNFKWWHGIWEGPVWLNMNWLIIRGLLYQANRFREKRYWKIAQHIAEQSCRLITKFGFHEFYNPFNGRGYRAKSFGWSTLAATFGKLFDD